MEPKPKFPLFIFGALAVVLVAFLFLGTGDAVVMRPSGWVAVAQRDLIVKTVGLMLIVVLPALAMTFFFAWKYRSGNPKAKYEPDWENDWRIEAVWWGIPCLIILWIAVYTWKGTYQLDPYQPIVSDRRPLKIQAVALQWKWLFLYPEQGIAAVNFVRFPVGTPLAFEITADAPMNSFWIPALGGQIYAMPGMETKLHLIADRVGVFRGCSANLSGEGFAGMNFTAEAVLDGEFENWAASIRGSSQALDGETYEALARPSAYVPPAFYTLSDEGLFRRVAMKGMPHAGE